MDGGELCGLCTVDENGAIIDLDEVFVHLLGQSSAAAVRGRGYAVSFPDAPPLPETGTSRDHRPIAGQLVEFRAWSGLGPAAHTVLASPANASQRELESIRQQLELILDGSPLAIVSLDDEQRVAIWSRAAEQMFGWTRDEVLGRPYPVVPEHEREAFQHLWDTVDRTGRGFTAVEGTRQRKDGSSIELRMHTGVIRDEHGRVVSNMALLEDLTETRALEQRARQSQKMEAVGSLAGGIAHDFNNLLAAIVACAELLELDDTLGPQGRRQAAEILEVANSARELVAQLMTFGQRQLVRPQLVDLNERVEAVAKLVGHVLGGAVELELELARDARLTVRIDPTQLDQILLNLAVNANDAMPTGGRLRYSTGIRELQRDALSSERFAYIAVRDSGLGIPSDVLPRIFDPFFTTKDASARTGLGLANVYAVVTGAGGHVEVESHEGEGTCFWLYLPPHEHASADPPEPSVRSDPPTLPRGRERILLVEDNDVVRRSTARLLGMLGYEVEVAQNGAEALALFDEHFEVDLVLTDLKMPVLGGAELARRLFEHRPTLPILFMSGNLDVAELREQVEQGRVSFLQKPVPLRELAVATRRLLDGGS